MFYAWDITISANTLDATPKEQILKLTHGIVTSIEIKFPSGCNGMVNVRILHRRSQLVPLSSGEWVTGNDETVPTETEFNLKANPFELIFVGCSPSTTYDHTITVRINIEKDISLLDKAILDKLGSIEEALTD